jgi:hypothetical protein
MKRFFQILLIGLITLTLASCVKTRAQKPVLEGVNENPVINAGDEFDPLAGITAKDKAGGRDITADIEIVGWDDSNTQTPGFYHYTIKIKNKDGLEASAEVNLTVRTETGEMPNVPKIVGTKSSETYFIGSGAWDPATGVTAEAPDGTDITSKLTITGTFLLDQAGAYVITYQVEHEGVRARKTLTLNVVSSEIPLELTKEPITITLHHAMGQRNAGFIRGYAESFVDKMAAEGYNITVEIPDGAGNYDTLKSNMINRITAGNMPNMVQGYPDHVAEYLNGKAVLNLTPYIEHEKWGLHGADAFTDIIDVYRDENSQYDAAGTFYSLPFNKSTEIMVYNKTAMEWVAQQQGKTLEQTIPTTWQEMFALAPLFRRYAQEVLLYNETEMSMVVPASLDSLGNAFITFTRQWDGKYTALNPDFTGQYLWADDANTFAAMQFLKDNKTNITIPEFWDQDYASTPFINQQTFMTIGSSAGITYNDPKGAFELGTAPVPYNADKPTLKQVIQQGTNISLMKTGNAQEMLVSWLFLKHLISTENTIHWSMNTGYLPVRTSAYESEIYQAFLNTPTAEQKMTSLSANAAYLQTAYMFYDPAFIGSSRARTQVGEALKRIINGDGNIQAALDFAYSEANLSGK